MKNIFKIFKRDIKKLFSSSMAIILAVGVAVLPSLYAWINIYANWDPYGSTSNMMIAVAIEDEGCTFKDLTINVGDEVEKNLKANKSIDWQFVNKKEAINGTAAGKYYAAIVIPKNFSESLTSIVSSNFEQPKITYYANEKKNAIATKITDKVVQTVQTQVNESFVTSVINILNAVLGTVVTEADAEGASTIKSIQKDIKLANKSITSLEKTLDGFSKVMDVAQQLNTALSNKNIQALLNDGKKTVESTEDVVVITKESVEAIVSSVEDIMKGASKELKTIAGDLDKVAQDTSTDGAKEFASAIATCKQISKNINNVIDALDILNKSLPTPLPEITDSIKKLTSIRDDIDAVVNDMQYALDHHTVSSAIESVAKSLRRISSSLSTATDYYNSKLKPKLNSSVDSLLKVLKDLSNLLLSINGDMPTMNTLVTSLNSSMDAGTDMVSALKSLLENSKAQLKSLSDTLKSLGDSEAINMLLNVTEGNADAVGEFVACPVEIKTEKVYAIDNYGSAMAPFYSTLAIWVGAIILTALFKTKVKNKKEIGPNVKPWQEYFGRGILFVLFSLVQGLIICLGDLYMLGIQCYEPAKFILSGLVASLVYSMFIYSLVCAFGDVGKSIAVILLVIQLGGSGGTFPIDVTPQFFQVLHPYLPFTFVVDAMRECICGTYANDYWIDLLKLLAYIPASLLLGTLFRYLFKNPLKFFNKSVEKTGLL